MKKIIFISHGTVEGDVRLLKLSRYLSKKGFRLSFLGWNRSGNETTQNSHFEKIEYVIEKGVGSKLQLVIFYFLFVLKSTLALNKRIKKEKKEKKDLRIYYAINFLAGLSIYFNSLVHPEIVYIYDIYDEFGKSYKFPYLIKKIINKFEKRIRKKAYKIIHVEENRVSDEDTNFIIIRNSPFDFYNGDYRYQDKERKFAVTGWLNNTRGLESIFSFAHDNSDFKFIIAGKFSDKIIENKFKSLSNVEIYDFMSQDNLFNLIKNCCGVFSLYDPTIEINRLAASNKLYDSMMLGIPVIVNKEIEAAHFVNEHNIGFIVDYLYNDTWDKLSNYNIALIKEFGGNGRKLYTNKFEFNSQMDKVFMPILNEIVK